MLVLATLFMNIRVLCIVMTAVALAGCATQTLPEHIAGSTEVQLYRRFGTRPDADEVYPATAASPRFQAVVRTAFPPGQPQSKSAMIREIRWIHGANEITVIFHQERGQWIAMDLDTRGRVIVY